jgi:ribosomal protein S18 acetylase RimI-like enzyme
VRNKQRRVFVLGYYSLKGNNKVVLNDFKEVTPNEFVVIGHFSAVAVPERFSKRGIGKQLIMACEKYILNIADELSQTRSNSKVKAELEMGVINVRKDLFPWYESQGFNVIRELRPNDVELTNSIVEHMDVCCVLMSKTLS